MPLNSLTQDPPEILRIKRKRTEDPLQALLLDDRRTLKRSKSSLALNASVAPNNNYIFKLARTDDFDDNSNTPTLLQSISKKSSRSRTDLRKVFSMPKSDQSSTTTDTTGIVNANNVGSDVQSQTPSNEVNPELLEMLNDYLKFNDTPDEKPTVKPPKRRMSSISSSSEKPASILTNGTNKLAPTNEVIDDDEADYVYDVYFRDKAVNDQWEKDKIGYIRFDEEDRDLLDEDEKNTGAGLFSDDEDSNDENFYRNEYPEDEDDGYDDDALSMGVEEPSDDQDDEFDIIHNRGRFNMNDVLSTEGLDDVTNVHYKDLYRHMANKEKYVDPEYDDFDLNDKTMSDDEDDTEEYQRHQFFKSDATDPIAVHRDKIFGRLDKMLKKKT